MSKYAWQPINIMIFTNTKDICNIFHPQDHLLQQVEVPSDHLQLQKLYVQHPKCYFQCDKGHTSLKNFILDL